MKSRNNLTVDQVIVLSDNGPHQQEKTMFNKILDLCTEYPFVFYCVGIVAVGLIAYATGLDCEKSPVACMMLVMK